MKGVDVSVWNDDVNWELLKENGIEFAIVRCSYGLSYEDENFLQNVNGAHELMVCFTYGKALQYCSHTKPGSTGSSHGEETH